MAVSQPIQAAFAEWEALGRPAQAAVGWQRERWRRELPHLATTLNALPDRLDRRAARAIVAGAPATPDGMFDAMVAVYAWGWSMTPVGVSRAATVLQGDRENVGKRLLTARLRLHAEGPLAGYSALAHEARIPGLGPSFGTKFLYFASTDAERALILDRLVYDWLRARVGQVFPANRWVPEGYERYLTLMARWGDELEIEAHVLEEIIFTSEATRRGLPGWGKPRSMAVCTPSDR